MEGFERTDINCYRQLVVNAVVICRRNFPRFDFQQFTLPAPSGSPPTTLWLSPNPCQQFTAVSAMGVCLETVALKSQVLNLT